MEESFRVTRLSTGLLFLIPLNHAVPFFIGWLRHVILFSSFFSVLYIVSVLSLLRYICCCIYLAEYGTIPYCLKNLFFCDIFLCIIISLLTEESLVRFVSTVDLMLKSCRAPSLVVDSYRLHWFEQLDWFERVGRNWKDGLLGISRLLSNFGMKLSQRDIERVVI